jgi:uncharacterized membrane protein YhaH (DUF805 family)
MKWMFLPFTRMTDFAGRSCRREYWMFMALKVVCSIALGLVLSVMGAFASASMFSGGIVAAVLGSTVLLIASLGWMLVFLLPEIALTVRRWHDIGNSGWTMVVILVFGMIPFIGFFAPIVHFLAMCTPGDKGPNKYGPSPVGAENISSFMQGFARN